MKYIVTKPYTSYTLTEAIKKLEGYCAYQDRCHKEVATKLKEMRMIPEAIDQIMTHLIQHNFLSEERFARSYARGKFNIKKWGKLKITRELELREISKFNIQIALREIDDGAYIATLDALARKKLASLSESDPQKKRKKLIDYLMYRGWESHLIYDKIRELIP
ncbi:regulatory protein RecX [Arenibacter sp. GZD96]|uniref:regulatory protein RecX n=1 Tax=Aurantibrevibacter litoralis TaxID=3106030 RepID=UPI002AFDCC82|nr:regulatory protein RecX [Arenibacter sp. GZD-96]MEA1787228.1 regulatory protein RecX [Arenibacter sp. GZD-96]